MLKLTGRDRERQLDQALDTSRPIFVDTKETMMMTELRTPLFTVEAWMDDVAGQPPGFQHAFQNPFYDREAADAYVKALEDQGGTGRVVPYYRPTGP